MAVLLLEVLGPIPLAAAVFWGVALTGVVQDDSLPLLQPAERGKCVAQKLLYHFQS